MYVTRLGLCLAVVLLASLPAHACDDEEPVRITVVAILASDQHTEVHPKLKEVAAEIQKAQPTLYLTGFKLAQTTCESLKVGEKKTFPLVDGQVVEVFVKQGTDKDGKVSLCVKPPLGGEITYTTTCGKFFPILTRYQTKDKNKKKERLIVAVMVRPCP